MTPEELEKGVMDLYKRFFSLNNIFYRIFIKSRCSWPLTIGPNLYFRSVVKKGVRACALPDKIS
jgi:hypothetical protein